MGLEKKVFHLLALGLLITLVGCAANTANHSGSQDTTEDGVSLPPQGSGDVALPPTETGKVEEVKPDAAKPDAPPSELLAESAAEAQNKMSALEVAPTTAPVEKVGQKNESTEFKYKVKAGQTLMQVAYDVYGDIHQWRHVLELNKEKLSVPSALKKGMTLVVDQDPKDAAAHPDGTPFKIRHGDTLGIISDDVYGTQAKWKRLWDNNKRLIKNPNRIYAGFYLYYLFTEQDRLEKESYRGLQRPAMIQKERDVSSVSKPAQAQ